MVIPRRVLFAVHHPVSARSQHVQEHSHYDDGGHHKEVARTRVRRAGWIFICIKTRISHEIAFILYYISQLTLEAFAIRTICLALTKLKQTNKMLKTKQKTKWSSRSDWWQFRIETITNYNYPCQQSPHRHLVAPKHFAGVHFVTQFSYCCSSCRCY